MANTLSRIPKDTIIEAGPRYVNIPKLEES
jgi:hypothetical protein